MIHVIQNNVSKFDRFMERLNGNPILEGFTLPKMMWVNEPELWKKVDVFVLPKDYVRYCLTGKIHMEYSDAASTLLLSQKHMIGQKTLEIHLI